MPRWKRLITEIHRRSLWQVLGIYVAGSWVSLQVVNELTDSIGLPVWVPGFAVVLLVIGFPIVMATAFVQEGVSPGPPDQAAGRGEAGRGEPEAAVTGAAGSSQAAAGAGPVPPTTARSADAESRPAGSGRTRPVHRLFTWRNALVGGGLAFVLLSAVTAGWIITRTLGIGPAATLVAKGVLEEREPIILADFTTRSDDSILARVATEAFRVDLSQSPVVTLLEPARLSEALDRMGRAPDGGLGFELARELAIREGVKAVVGGEINSAGPQYLISIRLVEPQGGEALLSERESASDSTRIVEAIDRLSRRVRERIGESLRSVRGSPALERVTTSSLEALRKYSQALQIVRSDPSAAPRSIALLEEAIALDSAFASAWRVLGTIHYNRGERAGQVVALTRAFEHRDRLPERERYLTAAAYYNIVTGEQERAAAAYRNLLEIEPDHHAALNNLGNIYEYQRDFPRAAEHFRRSAEHRASSATPLWNLTAVLTAQGDFDGADSVIDEMEARFPDAPNVRLSRALLAANRGDFGTAEAQLDTARAGSVDNPRFAAYATSGMAAALAARGRLAEGEARSREAMALAEKSGEVDQYLNEAAGLGWIDLTVRRDPAAALRRVERALEAHPLSELDPLDRPYLDLAGIYAAAGRPERARALVAAHDSAVGPALARESAADRELALAEIALAEARYEEAVAGFRRADEGYCLPCGVAGLARAYDAAGVADSALAYHERYLATPWFYWKLWWDSSDLGPTYERLGALYDERGDWERAAGYYARLVELWKDADPELQPRVEAARRRLQEILAEKG